MLVRADYIVDCLEDIDFEKLKSDGKSVLMFDLDSTIMPSKSGKYLPKTQELLKKLQQDFTVMVLSNNTDKKYIEKVKSVSDFEVISHAKKPRTKTLKEYLKKIGKETKDAVLIGDRPLTDILCGQNACVTTILVDSITKDTESKIVRIVRKLERLFIKK